MKRVIMLFCALILLVSYFASALPLYSYQNSYEMDYYEGNVPIYVTYTLNISGVEEIKLYVKQNATVDTEFKRLYFPIIKSPQSFYCNVRDESNNNLECRSNSQSTKSGTVYDWYNIDLSRTEVLKPVFLEIRDVPLQFNQTDGTYIFNPFNLPTSVNNKLEDEGFTFIIAKRYKFDFNFPLCSEYLSGLCIENLTNATNVGKIDGERGTLSWTFSDFEIANKTPEIRFSLNAINKLSSSTAAPTCQVKTDNIYSDIGILTIILFGFIWLLIQIYKAVTNIKIDIPIKQLSLIILAYLFMAWPLAVVLTILKTDNCAITNISLVDIIWILAGFVFLLTSLKPPRKLKKIINPIQAKEDIENEMGQINKTKDVAILISDSIEKGRITIDERNVFFRYRKTDQLISSLEWVDSKKYLLWANDKLQELDKEKAEVEKKIPRGV